MGVGDSPEAHEIPDDILANRDAAMTFTPEDVRRNSPKTLSLCRIQECQRDLDIFRKIYARLDPHWGECAGLGDHLCL